ncbi:hypothetical protein BH23GEM6_BH23GEM6_07820 [soil metagenome]
MMGLLFAVLLMAAIFMVIRRGRAPTSSPEEPWRASLRENEDEPLDLEEIRLAEEEWEAEGGLDWEEEDESWRG